MSEQEEQPSLGIFDRGHPDDALYEAFSGAPVGMAEDPQDGMPKPVIDTQQAYAPPLALDTMVCLEDRRQFVVRERQWGEIQGVVEPQHVVRTAGGKYRATANRINWLSGDSYRATGDHVQLEVFPIRPKCRHLARQLCDIQGNEDEVMMERCCTARRDSGGEFLSLMNQQVIACDMRDPYDEASVRYLDQFDDRKIRLGAERRAQGAGYDLSRLVDEPDDLEGVVE